jgi:hypothetical protein
MNIHKARRSNSTFYIRAVVWLYISGAFLALFLYFAHKFHTPTISTTPTINDQNGNTITY